MEGGEVLARRGEQGCRPPGAVSHEGSSFFPHELILPCTSDDLVVGDDYSDLAEPKGRLVAGFDVGRKRDLSVLAIFLRRDFPQVVPETFSNESKEVWASDFKILLQR